MDERRDAEGFSTRAIRAATRLPPVEQRPSSVPIYQTVTFGTSDAAELGDVLSGQRRGYAYSRLDNPTAAAMARGIAELEGAEDGYAFGSGMAAIHAATAPFLRTGDRVVAARSLYGGTRQLFAEWLPRFGIRTDFVDPTDLVAVEEALSASGARLLYLETIANPNLVVSDLPRLAELGHRYGALVVVDNTFASPYLCRPAELGCDLVIESCTKWIGGHSDVLAGVVVGRGALIDDVRAFQIDTGGAVAPFSAFLVLRGLETLAVRMDRHAANAATLAQVLETELRLPVFYPGLPSHPQADVARAILDSGGGMVAFDVGSRAAAATVVDTLSIPERTASLGSVKTMAVHPPSTSHRQLDSAGLAAAGIPEGLIRVSVGLEDVEDLIADVRSAIEAARPAVPA